MLNSANLWFFCALGTAVLWGLSYAISEKVMKDGITPIFIMVTTGFFYFVIAFLIAYFSEGFKSGFTVLETNKSTLINLLIMSLAFIGGTFLIYYAINLKNATYANLIEITYPIFTLLFAYILYKEIQINISTMIGGIMIFAGVVLIYIKS
ncbi:MAG: EamA family transporter [Pseudomonadota bacterium]